MKVVHKLSAWANFLSYMAIPVACTFTAFPAAFSIWDLPASFSAFNSLTLMIIWAQLWFWSCLFVSIGLVLKKTRDSNLYIWFEYPGLIVMSITAAVYAVALVLKNGILPSYIAMGAFAGIAFRFFFRWLEVHLLLMDTLRHIEVKE